MFRVSVDLLGSVYDAFSIILVLLDTSYQIPQHMR
jgi:hypothetical protein